MITTTHGDMDEATLVRIDPPVIDDDNEHTIAVEYWRLLPNAMPCSEHPNACEPLLAKGAFDIYELVHRSAHVALKKPLTIESAIGEIPR